MMIIPFIDKEVMYDFFVFFLSPAADGLHKNGGGSKLNAAAAAMMPPSGLFL